MTNFEEFERDWKRRHRASIPRRKRTMPVQEYFWIVFWLIVAAGAAIYSAAHTVPAAEMTLFKTNPDRDRLALAAFIIVELVIFGAAAKRHEIGWLKYLLFGVLAVALSSNVGSSITAVAENGGTWLNQLGGTMLAIIAPFTAFAAGEVLHIQLNKIAEKTALAQQEYLAQMKDLEATINREFVRLNKAQTDKEALPSLSNGIPLEKTLEILPSASTLGHKKQPQATEIAREHLARFPDDLKADPLELADRLGIGKSTMYRVIGEMKMQAPVLKSQNGNGHPTQEQS